MIGGLGTDLVEVGRIADKISKEQGFRELVFSPREIAYCAGKAHPFEHYAARFAGKEAFFKALGTGWAKGTSFNEVEILSDAQGKPEIHLTGETALTLAPLHIGTIWVSLSHIQSMASAVVIIEKKQMI